MSHAVTHQSAPQMQEAEPGGRGVTHAATRPTTRCERPMVAPHLMPCRACCPPSWLHPAVAAGELLFAVSARKHLQGQAGWVDLSADIVIGYIFVGPNWYFSPQEPVCSEVQ